MTDIVNPSPSGNRSFPASGAIVQGGGLDGWVVPDTEDHFATYLTDLADGPLNAFGESHSSTSLTVTIDTGEAYVKGKYVARDVTTDVTLDASTNNQMVYLGWPADSGNTVTIGTAGDFATNHDKIDLWEFDTDADGVTAARKEHRNTRDPADSSTTVRPDEIIPRVALDDGDSWGFGVPVQDGETLTVTGWGVRDNDDTTPAGLKVILVDETQNSVAGASTGWTTNPDGITSLSNSSGGLVYYWLRVQNDTGGPYDDPNGVTAAFAWEVA